jgi:hypothetical protein
MNRDDIVIQYGTRDAQVDPAVILAVSIDQYALIMSALNYLSTESEVRTAYRDGSKYSDCHRYKEAHRQIYAAAGAPDYPGDVR